MINDKYIMLNLYGCVKLANVYVGFKINSSNIIYPFCHITKLIIDTILFIYIANAVYIFIHPLD